MKNNTNKLNQAMQSRLITLPDETVILTQRKHWSVFMFPVIVAFVLGLISTATIITASSFFPNYLFFLLSSLVVTILFLSSLITKSIIDWYLNLYIVTNRKILEVSYKPLSSRDVSEVLLDQVKCTEIDTKIEGLINDFLDVGDVIITFDRPTHQEEFVFVNIPDPRKIEAILEKVFYNNGAFAISNQPNTTADQKSWYKNRNNTGKWTYIEELIPRSFAAN